MYKKFFLLISLCFLSALTGSAGADYFLGDDFESYSNTPNLKNTWDPTGATETWYSLDVTFVHMGSRSLKIWYDNNYASPYYCGVSRTMDSPKDWTLLGTAEGLSLWFRGSPNADQMYVRLKDSSDREALVRYTDFWDPANLVLEQWQQWKIDFGYFTDNNGDFDMTEVEMLEIGVGEPVGATPGVPYGGQIFFDDIKLYQHQCDFGEGESEADINKDCVVDWDEVNAMAGEWLDDGYDLEADTNRDGKVDFGDHAVMANNWGDTGTKIYECDYWQTLHPEWIFCDDFETTAPLVGTGRYFEYDSDSGDFIPLNGVGFDGSKGMRVLFQAGEVGAGALHLGFGRVPSSYFNKGIRNTEDFREIYYRMYLKNQDGWVGSPAKLSRAFSFAGSNWSQAMIAHLWSSGDYLLVDPASGVVDGVVVTTKYNDFDNLHWLGSQAGITPIFDSGHDNTWFCIEHHIKLNDPGLSNGIQEFWIDGQLEARRTGLNFVDTWTAYAINAVYLENYWNTGSSQLQERYFDNFVVSTQPIGCIDN